MIQDNTQTNIPYYSFFSTEDFCSKASTILGSTAIGCGAGALIGGVVVPGLGAPKGALIGAGTGLIAGIMLAKTWQSCKYDDWRKKQPAEALAVMEHKFEDLIENKNLICPITQQLIRLPVCLASNPKVFYDREALEQWVEEKGTDPTTRENVSKADIRVSIGTIIKVANVAQDIIQNSEHNQKLEGNEKLGFTLLSECYNTRARAAIKRELTCIDKLLNNNDLSLNNAGMLIQNLANEFKNK